MNQKEMFEMMVESGKATMDFDKFHELAEQLLGHPIWLHEFALEETCLELKLRLLTNHKSKRNESPLESLSKMVSSEQIIAIVTTIDNSHK